MGLDQGVGEFQRVRGGVADAVDAVHRRHHIEQFGEVGDAPVAGGATIAVDVLAQQGHLAHAVLGEVDDLGEDVVQRPTDLFAAGIGHHAEGAVLAAAFHDGDEGAGSVDARLGQAVELLDLGEGDVHLGRPGGARGVDHLRQAMQGLGPEDHVDIGGAVTDGSAFLAGHAAADADHQVGILQLEFAPATELGKHLFLRLLADRAGVEQDDVGLGRILGDFQRLPFAEQVDHARRIVFVHLAAMGFDIELLGHARQGVVRSGAAHYNDGLPHGEEPPGRRSA